MFVEVLKIFSTDGKFLVKIGERGSLKSPMHCIQYDRYLIVSDKGEHCIKVFDRNGNFQYKFGKKGSGDGEFHSPSGMAVNKSGHLTIDWCILVDIRPIFNSVSKVTQNCVGFAFLCSLICPGNSCHSTNQVLN